MWCCPWHLEFRIFFSKAMRGPPPFRSWSVGNQSGGMCSDSESAGGSSESRSMDSPSASPGTALLPATLQGVSKRWIQFEITVSLKLGPSFFKHPVTWCFFFGLFYINENVVISLARKSCWVELIQLPENVFHSLGDFKRRLPRTPSTGTMSSADDLDEREPPSPSDCGNVVSIPEVLRNMPFVVERGFSFSRA